MADNVESASALQELLAFTDLNAVPVTMPGVDPVFPTPFKVGIAGAAALAAVGTAVSHLWRLKTNRIQQVRIGVRAAAAALRSVRYLRIDGQAPKDPWDPFSGYYPVKDGRWVSIHCNFANHREAALGVLGSPAIAPPRRRRARSGTAWSSKTRSTPRRAAPASRVRRRSGRSIRIRPPSPFSL